MFQFHEGPIKTTKRYQSFAELWWFQFHEGPIKTTKKREEKLYKTSFNSMKVRLKLQPLNPWLYTAVFQFHEGPIKTRRERERNKRYT